MTRGLLIIGATGSVGRLVASEALERNWHVRTLLRRPERTQHLGTIASQVEILIGDGMNPADISPALEGVTGIILTHGDDRRPWEVNYGVVAALGQALEEYRQRDLSPHIALMSSINVTRVTGAYADILGSKLKAEELAYSWGLPVTVIRPGWFDNGVNGREAIEFTQGDQREYGPVDRHHIAQALVASLTCPEAIGKTVEIFSTQGDNAPNWSALFRPMHRDLRARADGNALQ